METRTKPDLDEFNKTVRAFNAARDGLVAMQKMAEYGGGRVQAGDAINALFDVMADQQSAIAHLIEAVRPLVR